MSRKDDDQRSKRIGSQKKVVGENAQNGITGREKKEKEKAQK